MNKIVKKTESLIHHFSGDDPRQLQVSLLSVFLIKQMHEVERFHKKL